MKDRALNIARIVWFLTVWKLQLWRIRPMRVYSNGLQVWLQRPGLDAIVLDADLVADVDEPPLVTVLSSRQRLTVALHATHLAESAGALGSAMTAEYARLMSDQLTKQIAAARAYVAEL